VSPAKVDEPIKVPFGLWTCVGPRNRVLDGGMNPPRGRDAYRQICSNRPHLCIAMLCMRCGLLLMIIVGQCPALSYGLSHFC